MMSGNKDSGLFAWALDFMSGHLLDKSAEPDNADVFRIGFHKKLKSGYDTREERMERLERLKEICAEVTTDPNFETHDLNSDGIKETFCNIANARIAAAMGCGEITESMLAEEQIRRAENSDLFSKVDALRAANHAKMGGYAFAGKIYDNSSHVAAVYPSSVQFSGSWGIDVCVLANVGKKNGVMKASLAFPVKSEPPAYYIFGTP